MIKNFVFKTAWISSDETDSVWLLASLNRMPPCQNKMHFKRFLDSVLQKSTKLKSWEKEIKEKYKKESIATFFS